MMFQISFLAIGLSALMLAIAYIFKRYQRAILWTVALILFIGTNFVTWFRTGEDS